MKLLYYLFFILFLAVSCNEQDDGVMEMHEIMPKSKYQPEKDTVVGNSNDLLALVMDRFNSNGVGVDTIKIINSNLFPDRFSPVHSEKFAITNASDDFQYYNWSYGDSSSVMNSFYNWWDALGQGQIGISSHIQEDYLCILVGDTNLIFIDGSEEIDGIEWVSYHNSIGYSNNWYYIIEQPAGGKTKWYQCSLGELQEFKLNQQ